MTKTFNLLPKELSFLVKNRYIVIECDCGNKLLVWPNRNNCACHRARCLRCKQPGSYALEWKKLKTGWVSRLHKIDDTYEDYQAALIRQDCAVVRWAKSFQNPLTQTRKNGL